MSFISSEDFAFGPFRLSVRHRTLAGREGWVSLKSRAFDVLLTLIERRGAVVSKDDLMRRVWGGLVVEENNLHVQIAAVRRALGPDNRYILTIPGRGYRFTGDLQGEAGAPDRPGREVAATNLPGQIAPLVGRREELAAVAGMLGRARLVTLIGPSGAGKTKLAIEAARSLQGRFAAGCWWAALGSVTDAALALRAVAAGLRTDEISGLSLIDGLVDLLGRGEVLLVLDGCERVSATVADLAGALLRRCPGLSILSTSHAPLGAQDELIGWIAPPALAPRRPDAPRSFAWRADDAETPDDIGGLSRAPAGPDDLCGIGHLGEPGSGTVGAPKRRRLGYCSPAQLVQGTAEV